MKTCARINGQRGFGVRVAAAMAVGFLLAVGTPAPAVAGSGDLDRSFGPKGSVQVAGFVGGDGIALQANGKIVVAGGEDRRFSVARFRPDGRLDRSFGGDGIVSVGLGSGACYSIAKDVKVQPDGRIVAIGTAEVLVGPAGHRQCTPRFALARFLPDGSLDRSFSDNGSVVTGFGDPPSCGLAAVAGALTPYGKIVAAGFGCHDAFTVARFTRDGSPDTTFGDDGRAEARPLLGVEASRLDVAVQRDGRIVVAGSAISETPPDGAPPTVFGVARLGLDGELDATFDEDGLVTTSFESPRCGGPAEATSLVIQPNGRIIVGGDAGCADTVGGIPHPRLALARYRPDGSLDATFGSAGRVRTTLPVEEGMDYLYAIALQRDGRIVASGTNGRYLIVRYRPAGNLDRTFGTGGMLQLGKPLGWAFGIAIQPDRRIVAAGATHGTFTLARLLP